MIRTTALAFAFLPLAYANLADAATILTTDGEINVASGWNNGLPDSANPGTISVNGVLNGSGIFGYEVGTDVNHTAGTISVNDAFNLQRTTWNMSGGSIDSFRYFLSNGANTTFNLSSGILQMNATSTDYVGVANGGTLNISGAGIIDAYSAHNGSSTIDFAADWSGSWTSWNYSSTDWRDLLVGNSGWTFNGVEVDGVLFDSTFSVTNGGQSLSLASAAALPEPSSLFLSLFGLLGLVFSRLHAQSTKKYVR